MAELLSDEDLPGERHRHVGLHISRAPCSCLCARSALVPENRWIYVCTSQGLFTVQPAPFAEKSKGQGWGKKGSKRQREDDEYHPALSPGFVPPHRGKSEGHELPLGAPASCLLGSAGMLPVIKVWEWTCGACVQPATFRP